MSLKASSQPNAFHMDAARAVADAVAARHRVARIHAVGLHLLLQEHGERVLGLEVVDVARRVLALGVSVRDQGEAVAGRAAAFCMPSRFTRSSSSTL